MNLAEYTFEIEKGQITSSKTTQCVFLLRALEGTVSEADEDEVRLRVAAAEAAGRVPHAELG